MPYPDLTSFKALSFDVYGTLINQEPGMIHSLQPLLSRLPDDSDYKTNPVSLMQRFSVLYRGLAVDEPTLRFNLILQRSFKKLANELDVAVSEAEIEEIGNSPGTWEPFPDTIPGMQILKKHYKLIAVTNMDNANASSTVKRLQPVEFDKVYTAEDIGSYKPAHANFDYLFSHVKSDLQIDRDQGELLHVARSLIADHVPAKQLGLRSVWICRGGDKKEGSGTGGDFEKLKHDVAFEWKFDSIGDFAEEVEKQFNEKSA
ncbi:haloacid type ii [Fusarium longipes]|uniref:Haloacid type ii n=1 Tax=Fusarium longipes TaxID=694270 RepID=A0A395SXM3_9HYPO|nr:haloacid type ii [Fusarium longipes]